MWWPPANPKTMSAVYFRHIHTINRKSTIEMTNREMRNKNKIVDEAKMKCKYGTKINAMCVYLLCMKSDIIC